MNAFHCINLNCMNGLRKVRSTSRLFLLFSNSQVEKCLSNHLIEPVELNVIVKRRLNLEKSDLPLIEVEGNLELFKVWICLISVFNFADILNSLMQRARAVLVARSNKVQTS